MIWPLFQLLASVTALVVTLRVTRWLYQRWPMIRVSTPYEPLDGWLVAGVLSIALVNVAGHVLLDLRRLLSGG